jgi:NADH-quinone oxidoreductase subunit J
MFIDVLFYLFSAMLLLCATSVVLVRNTLYNVLLLIVAFFNASGLFLLAGAEFLAMIMVIVYVGAVAVLLLFVVMMIDNRKDHTASSAQHFRKGMIVVPCLFAIELLIVCVQWQSEATVTDRVAFNIPHHLPNAQALGELLYTHYFFIFQLSGLLLLVAMIGAIVLTASSGQRRSYHKQDITRQLQRRKKDTLVLKRIEFRRGLQ